MNRLTEDQRLSRRIGLKLLGLLFLVFLSSTSRAAQGNEFTDVGAQYSRSGSPVLVCGGKIGNRGASLNIRGTDVAAIWHSAYRMLVPGAALADSKAPKVGVNTLPHKGPEWGINLSHGDAMVTLQTKW